MSFNTEHRDNQHETLYMFVDQSQMMYKDTDLLMDRDPSEYSTIKMESYDSNLVSYDSTQRLVTTFTRQHQLQPQLHDSASIGTRTIHDGDHNLGMNMMDMISSSSSTFEPSQSSDSGMPSVPQSEDTVDKSYLNVYMPSSEPTSSSDPIQWTASNQSQNELTTDGVGSQDSEDRLKLQQRMMITTKFGSSSPLRQHGGNDCGGDDGSGNEGSPTTRFSIHQHTDTPFTNGSSPTLSVTTVTVASSSSPLSSSSPIAEIVESPEEIAFRRAEQNRAAQRAFRQRKQKYIKWLESKAEELDEVYRILALVRTENQQLCNLVMELDGKLSHRSGGGTKKDLKRLSSPAALAIGSSSSSPSADAGAADVATAVTSSLENRIDDGSDAAHGMANSTTLRGIDGWLGREISMRLMNLATFPGLGSTADQDAAMLKKLKYHPQSSNIGKTSSGSSGSGSTGRGGDGGSSNSNSRSKMNLKVGQHSKRPGAALHNAVQPSTLLRQQQLQHKEQLEYQQKKQKQHQQQQQQPMTDGSW
ncbi:hypothetical protein BGZ95_005109, partial [Linnemannia exigua]